ncbi:histone deacetylase [Streptomyces sp. NPDC018031]|uniref:histone deacetylase n=1 Tax=Streptomyces sp. NPDC018031 TaxID=3365033 RepID=UPI00378BBD96
MHLERLRCYLSGGRPPGATRDYPGCRDGRPPAGSVPLVLPGRLYFATESPVWTGGRAFYDPAARGELWARAHLVTTGQFSDIAAQEMYREPGDDLDLREVLTHGRAALGPGRYETLVCPGLLDGTPVLTFTAPWRLTEAALNPPSAAYLQHLGAGLGEAGAWRPPAIAAYLARSPGAADHWTEAGVTALVDPGRAPGRPGRRSRPGHRAGPPAGAG